MSYYGNDERLPPLGALCLDYTEDIHRPPGDVIVSESYRFPIIHEKVKNATLMNVVKSEEFDADYLKCFVDACKKLEDKGCIGIITSCGFLAQIQKTLASKINVPIATSSLLQIPYVLAITSPNTKVGVLTFDSTALSRSHFNSVGVTDQMLERVVVVGCDPEKPLQRVIKHGDPYVAKAIENELVQLAVDLVTKNPTVKSIVLECTNMPPYSRAIQKRTKLPVFDGITMVEWFYSGLHCKLVPPDNDAESGLRRKARSKKEVG